MNMSSPAAGAVRTLARTPAAAAGYDLTSRAVVACSVVTLAAVTGLDLLDGRLGAAFSIGFILVALTAATAVQMNGLFTVGVLPPFLLVGALLVVSLIAPEAIVIANLPDSAGVLGLTLAATVTHGVTLLVGHALAVAVIVARIVTARGQVAPLI